MNIPRNQAPAPRRLASPVAILTFSLLSVLRGEGCDLDQFIVRTSGVMPKALWTERRRKPTAVIAARLAQPFGP